MFERSPQIEGIVVFRPGVVIVLRQGAVIGFQPWTEATGPPNLMSAR